MRYGSYIDELAAAVDDLAPRARASVFWLSGSALRATLVTPPSWHDWIAAANHAGFEFATTGVVRPAAAELREGVDTPTGSDESQRLHSTIVCLSTPLAIALDPNRRVGPWIEHAFCALITTVSLEMTGDVAMPGDDDELDEVVAQSVLQDVGATSVRSPASLVGPNRKRRRCDRWPSRCASSFGRCEGGSRSGVTGIRRQDTVGTHRTRPEGQALICGGIARRDVTRLSKLSESPAWCSEGSTAASAART